MSRAPSIDLAAIGPGFADPVHGAQRAFRAMLEAMSRPGRVQSLPADLLAGPPAPGLGPAATAALLTLLDEQVRVWLSPALRGGGLAGFLRFHCGADLVDAPADATVVALTAGEAGPSLWADLNLGSDEAPQDGATVLIDAVRLDPASRQLVCSGPGIESVHRVGVRALDDTFWAARETLAPLYPRGADLLLCDGNDLAGVPRTTRLTLGE